MKKATMIAVLTAMAKNAVDYDDFTERLEHLEKALGEGWALYICVDADVADLNNPQWYTVTVCTPTGRTYDVNLTEYLKGVD